MSRAPIALVRQLAGVVLALVALPSVARGQDVLVLSATPPIVHPGETVTFDVTEGEPSAPVGLFVAQVGFTPIFFCITIGTFDAAGQWLLDLQAPSDPAIDADIDVVFVAYGIAEVDGRVHGSNYVMVSFRSS